MKWLLYIVLLSYVSVSSSNSETMAQRWDAQITLMTGVPFPRQITCHTEKVFNCNFDTENCDNNVSDYREDFPAQTWSFDFSKMRVTMDKGNPDLEAAGELRYLGGTTYLMSLDKYPQRPGWIASFSHLDTDVYLSWYVSSSLGIAIQGHSGRCEVNRAGPSSGNLE